MIKATLTDKKRMSPRPPSETTYLLKEPGPSGLEIVEVDMVLGNTWETLALIEAEQLDLINSADD